MIVGPKRGLFFVATALMYAASLYGAESLSATDPMARIFVGEPNQLTVPPGFREALAGAVSKNDCTPQLRGADVAAGQILAEPASEAQQCTPLAVETVAPAEPAPAVGLTNAKSTVVAQPASAASTVEHP